MEKIKKILEKPITEQLFKFRKELFEQQIYEDNKELKHTEKQIVKEQEELNDFIRKFITNQDDFEKYLDLFRKVEISYGDEINFWNLQYYKLGIAESQKIKKELLNENSDDNFNDNNMKKRISNLIENYFDDILEMIEDEKSKTLSRTPKYLEMGKRYDMIDDKTPKAIFVYEDFRPMGLTKEESEGIIELVKQDKEMAYDETKLAFKLGVKMGASL